jgi:iron complex outermembrane recepter protein
MRKPALLFIVLICALTGQSQTDNNRSVRITIFSETRVPLAAASAELLNADSSVLKVAVADSAGIAAFTGLEPGLYFVRIRHSGHRLQITRPISLVNDSFYTETVILLPQETLLQDVTVTGKKPLVRFLPDKTVINPEAAITNAGATVMDVLEKSPGITIGKDGTITMKGKPQVMVLIDGRQTQLNGAELQAYLSGMNAAQVDVIELIENPGARYDAAGNAGIINIKTKKNKQKGFNGSLSVALGQGYLFKNNNSLNLNYRIGKFNFYTNYSNRFAGERMDMYALRKYFNTAGADSLLLQQPNITRTRHNTHSIKAGVDFMTSAKTTLGLSFTGNLNKRRISSFSTIDWMSPLNVIDSTILTSGTRNIDFERAGFNVNARHSFNATSEVLVDFDYIRFGITGDQYFETQLSAPGSTVFANQGSIPSSLDITTAKLDYSKRFKKIVWEAGLKTAHTNTDNRAGYSFFDGTGWQADLSRSNHFLYDEKIHSVYSSLDAEQGKWHWQAGLRYELTSYKANQLGNAVIKDSAFEKNYGSLFPSAFVSYNADSSHTFTLRAGRRIDRPQFQNLNPFIVTINKYTFEGGNPFIRPQYTWNLELLHTYKEKLTTGISYSYLSDYFSQLFIIDSNSSNVNKNIIIYTRGNVGRFQTIGLSASLQQPVTSWWNLTAQVVYNHKIIEGVVWAPVKAIVNQVNININNQFQLGKGWAAELSGYYLSNSQIDLQETLTPQGEMGAGLSKQVLKGRGSLRLAVRDLFYTQNYSGYSKFQNSDEPFKIKWDSRVVRLSFNWRFGKAMKAVKRSGGGAVEEAERVGSGG